MAFHDWQETWRAMDSSTGEVVCRKCGVKLTIGHARPSVTEQLKEFDAEDCNLYILRAVLES